MTDSDAYLPSASFAEGCYTSYSSSKEEMEVASTVQPYEGEPCESNEDFYEDWLSWFVAYSFRSRLEQKNSRDWIFSLLRLCFVFYSEIYVKNG